MVDTEYAWSSLSPPMPGDRYETRGPEPQGRDRMNLSPASGETRLVGGNEAVDRPGRAADEEPVDVW
jgi:hypothetical protein